MQKARGYTALKSVLDILATEAGLTAAEIARKLMSTTRGASRSHATTTSYHDPVLRYWVAMVTRGIEVPPSAPPMELSALLQHLDRLYRVASMR